MDKKQETTLPHVQAVDPLTGKPVKLEMQQMRLHPCEIIAENPNNYSDDPVAVRISQVFYRYHRQGIAPPSESRVAATCIDATDLFDPELLTSYLASGR